MWPGDISDLLQGVSQNKHDTTEYIYINNFLIELVQKGKDCGTSKGDSRPKLSEKGK